MFQCVAPIPGLRMLKKTSLLQARLRLLPWRIWCRLRENKGCQPLCDSRVKLICFDTRFNLSFVEIPAPVLSQRCNLLCRIVIKLKSDSLNVPNGKHYQGLCEECPV